MNVASSRKIAKAREATAELRSIGQKRYIRNVSQRPRKEGFWCRKSPQATETVKVSVIKTHNPPPSRTAAHVLRKSGREQLVARASLQRRYMLNNAAQDAAQRRQLALQGTMAELLENGARPQELRVQNVCAGTTVSCEQGRAVRVELLDGARRRALPPVAPGMTDVSPIVEIMEEPAARARTATDTEQSVGAQAEPQVLRAYVAHSSCIPSNVRVLRLVSDESGAHQEQATGETKTPALLDAPGWENVACETLSTGQECVRYGSMIHFQTRSQGVFRLVQPRVVPEFVNFYVYLGSSHPRTVRLWAVANRVDQTNLVKDLEAEQTAKDADAGRPDSFKLCGVVEKVPLHGSENVLMGVHANPVALPRLSAGTSVFARFKGGMWFKARVSKNWGNGRYDVMYDDGKRVPAVPDDHIKKLLVLNEPCKARCASRYNAYYPAVIWAVHRYGTYNVKFDHGEMGYKLSCEHVRPVLKPLNEPLVWHGSPVCSVPLHVPFPHHSDKEVFHTKVYVCTEDGEAHAHDLDIPMPLSTQAQSDM